MAVVNDDAVRRAMIELARACLGRFLAIQSTRRRITEGSAAAVSAREAELAGMPGPVYEDDEFPQNERIEDLSSELGRDGTRLARLARTCSLSELDLTIVALLLAPELDPELERGYAYALDDFTKRRPDLRFIAQLLGGVDTDRIDEVLTRFDESAPLRRFGVIAIGTGDGPWQLRTIRLADRIVAFFRSHET